MSFRNFTVGMTITVSDEKELGTCSFLISINIININIIVNILILLESVKEEHEAPWSPHIPIIVIILVPARFARHRLRGGCPG